MVKFLRTLLLLISVLALLVVAAPPSSAGGTIAQGRLRNYNSAGCIQAEYEGNFSPVEQRYCVLAPQIQLYLTDASWPYSHMFKLVVLGSAGQPVGCIRAFGPDGDEPFLIECASYDYAYEMWALEYDPSDTRFRLKNVALGQCLAVPGGSTQEGVNLIMWPCGTWNDHYWVLM